MDEENEELFETIQMDKTIDDAKKFISDFYSFLDKKGQKHELKNFVLEFTLSRKREEEFTCKMCNEQNYGVKYTCTHCGIFYCQKCFDVNKFMKKHPHVFIADTGSEGEEFKKIFELIKSNPKSAPQPSKINPNYHNQPRVPSNDNQINSFMGNQDLIAQLNRDNLSNNNLINRPNNPPNREINPPNRPNNPPNNNLIQRANRINNNPEPINAESLRRQQERERILKRDQEIARQREMERKRREEEERRDQELARNIAQREQEELDRENQRRMRKEREERHHGMHHVDEEMLFEEERRRNLENIRRDNQKRNDPEMQKIRMVMDSLDKNFHVKSKYREESIISAIKYADFDECKAYEKLLTLDTAHL